MNGLNWSVDSLKLPGQISSGDQHLVCARAKVTLVAVVDGLGHGDQAAEAACAAISVLQENVGANVISLIRRCHDKLRSMRGAVMSLASFNVEANLLSWIGVGNVGGILLRGDRESGPETLMLRGGVVGGHLPPLQAAILPVSAGDTLIFATDGVRGDFTAQLPRGASPEDLAKRILSRYASHADEALVLVARYTGEH